MSTPDAEDASSSPEYSGDQDGSDMAAELKDEKHHSDGSPSQQTSNRQKASSNAKDPLRPRRKKARRACFACQRAHLTCGDERPCHRCTKRGLEASCMDGVRKKAKYLHDAPDAALMPGIGGNYVALNGNHHLGGQDAAVSLAQQGDYYTQAPNPTYYAQAQAQGQVSAPIQDAPVVGPYNQQAPISPPYSRTNQAPLAGVPSTAAPQMQQFGGPLFDPSDPALFNFDISGLNFGNHYGALEVGMLGHMSSGAAETPPSDTNVMNPLNQAANVYNPHMTSGSYNDSPTAPVTVSFNITGLPSTEWEHTHSRQGSLQIQTPNNTPATANIDSHPHRNDSLNGPHAYAIGQGTSISSASPASTDVNTGYDNENPLSSAAFFANSNKQHGQQGSPTMNRLQQENRIPGSTILQPIQSNALRRRRRDTRWIYESIKEPYNYVIAFHRLFQKIDARFSPISRKKVNVAFARLRPVLMAAQATVNTEDLIHTEQNLQCLVLHLEDHIFPQVGLPSLICRRSGELVGLSKEFEILTGWKREVLLGQAPNMNVNTGPPREPSAESGFSTRSSTTPIIAGQAPQDGPFPVSILDLLDEKSAAEWLDDLSEISFTNAYEVKRRRVGVMKYRTKEDVARIEELKASGLANGRHIKQEAPVKAERGTHHGEGAISQLGAEDGLVDCMISWNVRRDTFDMPFLACMQIMPVLDKRL
ncbi:hypothetical protein BDV96DRAFT_611724 [Lophiotrema nucula]|uniref:Zn(2)-C6 fungal-type domain-containing protein n=1 Tax=Lophiotrema nucula TaxID=690887 RepID=A0A6A5ZFY0_9PLEO|nr:hypothetical protein BDV96DRAFT_611724 [Lophiotrema nucula]